ncbi:MAG: hypothetical protein ACRDF4_11285, partial [Rhabdochlamydiaceae bacterium]
FLFSVIKKILEKHGSGNPAGLAGTDSDLAFVLERDSEAQSMGRMYSTFTDVLERMRPSELYHLVADLRTEPFHQLDDRIESPRCNPTTWGGVSQYALNTALKPVAELPRRADFSKPAEVDYGKEPVKGRSEHIIAAAEQRRGVESETLNENPVRTHKLEVLIDQLAESNARINALSNELVGTKQKLENFEKNISESGQRMEAIQHQLSNVPKRLDEIEVSLTTIVRNSI